MNLLTGAIVGAAMRIILTKVSNLTPQVEDAIMYGAPLAAMLQDVNFGLGMAIGEVGIVFYAFSHSGGL